MRALLSALEAVPEDKVPSLPEGGHRTEGQERETSMCCPV